jgi:hypothetical protein
MARKIDTNPTYAGTRQIAFNIVEDSLNPTAYIPPLYMQVNPESFKTAYRKLINRYQTFAAFVEEYWGDELDTVSCNASTGGFVLEDVGLSTLGRSYTKSFYNFQDILDVYRNNGNVYSNDGRVLRKGDVIIYFDECTYFGLFESFNYTEDAEKPFRFV